MAKNAIFIHWIQSAFGPEKHGDMFERRKEPLMYNSAMLLTYLGQVSTVNRQSSTGPAHEVKQLIGRMAPVESTHQIQLFATSGVEPRES